MITFKAKKINSVYIKRYNSETLKYEPCLATFIRFDKKSAADYEAINGLTWLLGTRQKYATNIVNNFNKEYKKKFKRSKDGFYAITLQTDNFENIDSDKIIGLAEALKKMRSIYLNFLQVDPKYKFGIPKRKYKEVGKSAIDSFKDMRFIKRIFLMANAYAAPFYEAQGFKQDGPFMSYINKPHRGFLSDLISKLEYRTHVKAEYDEC